MRNILEGLQIFDRIMPYDEYAGFAAEHDVVYAGPHPEIVSDEDKAKLEELGWHPSEEFDCFYHFT